MTFAPGQTFPGVGTTHGGDRRQWFARAEQLSFEEHYFDCIRCFARVRDLRDLQQELGRMAPQIRQEHAAPAAVWMPRWAWVGPVNAPKINGLDFFIVRVKARLELV